MNGGVGRSGAFAVSSTPSSASSRERSVGERGVGAPARAVDVDADVERDLPVGEHRRRGRRAAPPRRRRGSRAAPPAGAGRRAAASKRVHADAGQRVERAERLVEQQQVAARARARGRARPVAPRRPRACFGQSSFVVVEADLAQRVRARVRGRRRRAGRARRCRCTVAHGSSRASWKTTARRRGHDDRALDAVDRARRAPATACSCPEPLRPSSATNSPAARLQVDPVEHLTDPNVARRAERRRYRCAPAAAS